ncbi:MAG: thioredoxin family protein [Candidatus Marinimicrobia bacterium]|nr:thioredoxin family protein [Candidatus Neomarinimicrobiota bacterium]
MKIQILGTGCTKCNQLFALTEKAVEDLDLAVKVEKVSDINEIVAFGIMTIPALVIDGKVEFAGNVPSLSNLKKIITKG